MVLPSTTKEIFTAFECESFGFDDATAAESGELATRSFLTASLNVECFSSDEHQHLTSLATAFIFLWPARASDAAPTLRCAAAPLSVPLSLGPKQPMPHVSNA